MKTKHVHKFFGGSGFRMPRRALTAVVALVALGLTACGGGGGGSSGGGNTPEISGQSLYIANSSGLVSRTNGLIVSEIDFTTGNTQGLEQDIVGSIYQAGDTAARTGPGNIRTICQFDARSGDAYNPRIDRQLGGTSTNLTTLVNPKGIALAHRAGFLLVANFNDRTIRVWGSSAAGNVAPIGTTVLPVNPWGLAYDEPADLLFIALTDGTIGVIDNYIAGGFGPSGLSRIIIPVDVNTTQISTNLHGIAYHAGSDRLVVSDVGAETAAQGLEFNRDGSIYVFDEASRIGGKVLPNKTIKGSATRLGNPGDLALVGSELRVAETTNDTILVFSNIFAGPGGNVAPSFSASWPSPTSILGAAIDPSNPDVSDIDSTSFIVNAVAASSNPADPLDPAFGRITHDALDLSVELATFAAGRRLENISFAQTGDAYVVFDGGSTDDTGILVVNRLANSRDGGTVLASRDRSIVGPATRLVDPKGVEIVDTLGWVMVADNDATAPAVRVFSTCASGDIAPLFSLPLDNFGRPWDLDYDPLGDRLYVALTNGIVLVFDRVADRLGITPRVIEPALNGVKIAQNLHGIVYVHGQDLLLLSDVRDAASNSDGALYMIEHASIRNGITDVSVLVSGPLSSLGNPVDIAFDGADLFVAEKANNLLLRFDNFVTAGIGDRAPDAQIAKTRAESVALVPDYLSATPTR